VQLLILSFFFKVFFSIPVEDLFCLSFLAYPQSDMLLTSELLQHFT